MILAERAARVMAEARVAEFAVTKEALEISRLEAAKSKASRLLLELEIEQL